MIRPYSRRRIRKEKKRAVLDRGPFSLPPSPKTQRKKKKKRKGQSSAHVPKGVWPGGLQRAKVKKGKKKEIFLKKNGKRKRKREKEKKKVMSFTPSGSCNPG